MTKKNATKALIAAILIVVASVTTWVAFYIDNDETTTPDTAAVIESVTDLVDTIGEYKDSSDEVVTNEVEIVE